MCVCESREKMMREVDDSGVAKTRRWRWWTSLRRCAVVFLGFLVAGEGCVRFLYVEEGIWSTAASLEAEQEGNNWGWKGG